MRSEYTLPLGTGIKEEYDKELEFGVCENCGDVGVKLLKFHGWVCTTCAYSKTSKKEDPSH